MTLSIHFTVASCSIGPAESKWLKVLTIEEVPRLLLALIVAFFEMDAQAAAYLYRERLETGVTGIK
jgi:hypothetical protein